MKPLTCMLLQRQRGQSMVEVAVMGGVITMLFIGIWVLGRFHDVQASTIQAARYAAWERTVHSPGRMSDARLQEVTRERLFSWNRDPFRSTDRLRNGDAWSTQSMNWRDPSGDNRLIERPRDVTVGTTNTALPGVATGAVNQAFNSITEALDGITGGEELPRGGLATGTVTVRLANLDNVPAPLNQLNMTLTERSSVVLDNWDASGPEQAARRTRTFTPAAAFAQLDGPMDLLRGVLSFVEDDFDEFHPGQVCPDVVPADRVTGGSNQPAYRGGGACLQ